MTLRRPGRRRGPRGSWTRPGHTPTAAIGVVALAALLVGSCTISSESPDAAALGGRSGPSSGTTTTTGAGDDGTTDESPAVPDADPQQDGGAADDGESASGDDDTEQTTTPGTAPAETDPPTGGGATDEDASSAGTEQAEPGTGEPETGTGSADDVDAAETETTGDTADAGDNETGTAADPEATVPDGTAETAFDERSRVSTVGIGSVYFGMSPEEAAERVGTTWVGTPNGGDDCYVVTPASGPPGVALWIYHGTVERVDVETPLLRTQSGLGVGTHLGELQSLLGNKLVVEEHPYLGGWTLATFVPTDPNDAAFRIAFDISGGEVIRFRTGRTEIVTRESCA